MVCRGSSCRCCNWDAHCQSCSTDVEDLLLWSLVASFSCLPSRLGAFDQVKSMDLVRRDICETFCIRKGSISVSYNTAAYIYPTSPSDRSLSSLSSSEDSSKPSSSKCKSSKPIDTPCFVFRLLFLNLVTRCTSPKTTPVTNTINKAKNTHFLHPLMQQGYHHMSTPALHSTQVRVRFSSGSRPLRRRCFVRGPLGPVSKRLRPKRGITF